MRYFISLCLCLLTTFVYPSIGDTSDKCSRLTITISNGYIADYKIFRGYLKSKDDRSITLVQSLWGPEVWLHFRRTKDTAKTKNQGEHAFYIVKQNYCGFKTGDVTVRPGGRSPESLFWDVRFNLRYQVSKGSYLERRGGKVNFAF